MKKIAGIISLVFAVGVSFGVGFYLARYPDSTRAANAGTFNFNGNRIINIGAPQASTDAATQAYVNSLSVSPATWTCTVRSNTSNFSSGTNVSCSGNEKLINGGCQCFSSGSTLSSYPTGQNWTCSCTATGVTAYANCCQ